ncbi:MAG: tetratricopeptide repeat protein [Nostochopsis sp.]
MRVYKFFLIIFSALLLSVSQFWWLSFSPVFGKSVVLGQTTDARKAEAARLLQQGGKQFQASQFTTALQSWEQALQIYREIKDREGEGAALGNLGNAYGALGNYPKAIEYHQQGLKLAREIKDRKSEVKVLAYLGVAYDALGNYSTAIKYYEQSLKLAREIKDPLYESQVLGNLGIAYNALGKYLTAIEHYKKSLKLIREIKDRKGDEVKVIANLGIPYFNLGDYSTAIKYYEQSLKLAREIKDRKTESQSLVNLAAAYGALGNYPKTIEYCQQSLKLARETNNPQFESDALGNLGLAYDNLGDYPKAIEYHQQSLKLAREIKYRQTEANALGNLGIAYLALGDYPKAIEYQQQKLDLATEIKNPQGESNALGNLGLVYYYLGNYPKAIKYYRQKLAITQEIKDRQGEGDAWGNISLLYHHLGKYLKAIQYQQKKLLIVREIKDRKGEGQSLANLGFVYLSLGDYPKAIDYYQQSLAIIRKIKDRQGEAQSLANLGKTYLSLGDYPKAIKYQQQSLKIARKIKDRQSENYSLNNLGIVFYKQGKLTLAESTLFESIKVKESLRGELKDNDKISIIDTQRNTYRILQQVLIAQNKTDAALEIAERGRARAFVELLASRLSPNLQQQSPPPPTIEEIKQIAKVQNATIVQYSIIYDEFKVQGKPQFKESELYIWVVKPTGEAKFRPVNLKPLWQQQNISLTDKVVQARESVVKGMNVASRSGNKITLTPGDRIKLNDDAPDWEAWQVVSVDVKNGKITIRLPSWEPGQASIERSITDVVEKITNSASANTKNSQLQELHQLLIQPIADLLPKEETARVIFIPQDSLFLVPFPALQDPSGQYLIDKHTILTAPSIQVVDSTHKLRQKVPGSAKDVVVVGNPTMPKLPKQLNPLPGSEKEALAIASFWKTQALIGNQATKNAVLQKLRKAKIIHLATHGLLDDIRGLGSSIVFAPEGQDNGLLTAEEILNLYTPPQGSTLSAELVVLSACDTGQGRLTGDGVIGLSRSIIAAGVPSVIVSLWSIPDAPTAELMTEFYQNLEHQQDKATALRQAMLTTKEKHPNPADWAAFTLIGESK